MKDPYEVLGVSRDANLTEVTQAYRKLAKKYHPDLNPGDSSAQKKMAEINVAYEEIKSGRAKYQDYSRPQQSQGYGGGYQGYGSFGGYGFDPFEAFGFGKRQTQQTQQQQDQFDPVRHYVNAMRYNEALYALSTIQDRQAEWYYLSALAHFGLGNRVTAMSQIDQAIAMDPNNLVYAQARAQMQGTYQQYTRRSQMFGMPSMGGLNTLCLGLCLARLCCRFPCI